MRRTKELAEKIGSPHRLVERSFISFWRCCRLFPPFIARQLRRLSPLLSLRTCQPPKGKKPSRTSSSFFPARLWPATRIMLWPRQGLASFYLGNISTLRLCSGKLTGYFSAGPALPSSTTNLGHFPLKGMQTALISLNWAPIASLCRNFFPERPSLRGFSKPPPKRGSREAPPLWTLF